MKAMAMECYGIHTALATPFTTGEARRIEEIRHLCGRRLWNRLYPVNRFLEAEGYVAAVKAGAGLRGLDLGPPRPPIKPLAAKARARLARLMRKLDPGLV